MPIFLLDRLPLPHLRAYTTISVLLLSASIYYAVSVTSDPSWKTNTTLSEDSNKNVTDSPKNETRSVAVHMMEIITFMVQEPICVWTLINIAYLCLILIGRTIQRLVFGELRVAERLHLKDKFWNFVFYKFIFVFGVVNVQYMDEVTLWCSWFSILGFLQLLSQLCKDRFEYLSFSPTTPGWSHARLLSLLTAIFLLACFLFLVCVGVGYFGGLNTFAFMAAECILLGIRTLHVLIRYGMHLYESRQGSFERRSSISYYAELIFELIALTIDLMHHLHMLLWSNIFLSMASLVICMQLRYLFHEIQRRVKKHRNYLWVLKHMEQNYPMASAEDLSENSDNCAICWEKMDSARKLPCTHLFHNSCLQSWLEQDTSCPTCRLTLSIPSQAVVEQDPPDVDSPEVQGTQRRSLNHFFHFDGSRYVSWLPSFSVEVTNMALLRESNNMRNIPVNSQLDSMARQVQQLFPHYQLRTIIQDLQTTRSVEITVDNVLEGRLSNPARFQMMEDNQDSTETLLGGHQNPFAALFSNHFTLQQSPILQQPLEMSNEPNLDTEIEPSQEGMDEPSPLGDRFSKSSLERERILLRRKEQMIQVARKRYMERHRMESSLEQSAGSTKTEKKQK